MGPPLPSPKKKKMARGGSSARGRDLDQSIHTCIGTYHTSYAFTYLPMYLDL